MYPTGTIYVKFMSTGSICRQKIPVDETIYPAKCCALGDKETDKKKKKAEITCHRKLPVANDRDLPAS